MCSVPHPSRALPVPTQNGFQEWGAPEAAGCLKNRMQLSHLSGEGVAGSMEAPPEKPQELRVGWADAEAAVRPQQVHQLQPRECMEAGGR